MSTITIDTEKRSREHYDEELWTTECLVDEVFLNLCKTQVAITKDNGRTITVKKYYRRARELMKWIPVIKLPFNEYVINLSDLTSRIREGLESVSMTPYHFKLRPNTSGRPYF